MSLPALKSPLARFAPARSDSAESPCRPTLRAPSQPQIRPVAALESKSLHLITGVSMDADFERAYRRFFALYTAEQ